MKTTFSLNETLALAPCSPGTDLINLLGTQTFGSAWNGDYQVDFDTVINAVKDKDPNTYRWIMLHKPQLLQYTNKQLQSCTFNGETFLDLDSAKQAREQVYLGFYENYLKQIVCNFCIVEGENHVWHGVDDITTFIEPSINKPCHYIVFNPKTGINQEVATLEDAINLRKAIAKQLTDELMNLNKIIAKYVYAEDNQSFIEEIIE